MPSIEVRSVEVRLSPVEAQTFDVIVSAPNPVVQVVSEGPQGPLATPYYGQISRITSGTVPGATAGTYRTTGLTATLDGQASGFALGTDDECGLRNVSGKRLLVRFYGSADVAAGNNHVVGLKLALNGVAVDNTECRSGTGQGSVNFAKTVTSWMLAVDPDDEVSLFVADFTGTGALTVQRCRLVATAVTLL